MLWETILHNYFLFGILFQQTKANETSASSGTANTVNSSEICIASLWRSLPFFFPSFLILNTAINTACVVAPAAPPFAIALVLLPRDWDVFIPVLCTSQAPSIILLKSAASWKWEGRLGRREKGTVDGFSMAQSISPLPPVLLHLLTWPSAMLFIILCWMANRHMQQANSLQPRYKKALLTSGQRFQKGFYLLIVYSWAIGNNKQEKVLVFEWKTFYFISAWKYLYFFLKPLFSE